MAPTSTVRVVRQLLGGSRNVPLDISTRYASAAGSAGDTVELAVDSRIEQWAPAR